MKCSNRVLNLEQSPIRKLTPFVDKAKENNIKVYPLNLGQPDIHTPKEFFEKIEKCNLDILSYTNSMGILELRKGISDYYKRYKLDFNEEEIFITNGASEALQFAFMSTCDMGENILVIEPFYVNYKTIANSLNIEIKPIHCNDKFDLPSEDILTTYVDIKTKAILLSNPNNPTGKVYTKEEVLSICKLALKYNLWIISDEVYREFIYDGIEFVSFGEMEEVKDRVILIDSISKKYSACGARIGNIACKNTEFNKNILKLCQSRLCVPTLEQVGAIGLYELPISYFEEMNLVYKNKRDILCNELDNIDNIRYIKSNGAFYIIVELPIKDANKFSKWVLTEFNYNNETILLCPAKNFYMDKEEGINKIRIAYTVDEKDLIKAIRILKKALNYYINHIEK